jgi:transcriptional regulator GlxA family with amidase domain
MEDSSARRCIALIVLDEASIVSVAGPAEVFTVANSVLERTGQEPAYRVICASRRGGLIATSSGIVMKTEPLASLEAASIDTLIVSGSPSILLALQDALLIDWIGKASRHVRRVCSIGTGSFLLAAAGLLNGQRAVTHACYGGEFRSRFPRVYLEDDSIYVQSGKFWVAAGMTAGIDLSLALLRADLGPRVALKVAKILVVFMTRSGGQAQQSALLRIQERLAQRGTDSMLTDLLGWVVANLSLPITVTDLAERAGMSARSFARFFVLNTGQTPAKLIQQLRVERACHMLEFSPVSIKSIAAQTGFVDDERMRRAFLRQVGITPAEYRARFLNPGASGDTAKSHAAARTAHRRGVTMS